MFSTDQISNYMKFGMSREEAIRELEGAQVQQPVQEVQAKAEQHFSALADDAYQLPREIANERAEHAERMAQMPVMELPVVQPQISNVVVEEPAEEPAQAQEAGVISFMKRFFTKEPVIAPEPKDSDTKVTNTTIDRRAAFTDKLNQAIALIGRAQFENPKDKAIAEDMNLATTLLNGINFGSTVHGFIITDESQKKINSLFGKYILFSDRPGISTLYDKLNQVDLGEKRLDANLNLVAANKSYGTRASTQKATIEAVKAALINRVLELLPLYHIMQDAPLTMSEQKVKGLAKKIIAKLNETEIHRVAVMKLSTEKVEIDRPIREREFMNS